MAIKLFHDYEIGKGLEYANSKVNVKPDNSGNVQFEVSEAGLKGNVQLPAAFDPSEINAKLLAAETKAATLEQQLTAEKAKVATLEGKVADLEARKDIRVSNAQVVDETKLRFTFENSNAQVEVDLAKFLQVVPSATEVYNEVKAQILADVKAALKGEEIQDFAGTVKGYLITNA